jgi:hypothetical protein
VLVIKQYLACFAGSHAEAEKCAPSLATVRAPVSYVGPLEVRTDPKREEKLYVTHRRLQTPIVAQAVSLECVCRSGFVYQGAQKDLPRGLRGSSFTAIMLTPKKKQVVLGVARSLVGLRHCVCWRCAVNDSTAGAGGRPGRCGPCKLSLKGTSAC